MRPFSPSSADPRLTPTTSRPSILKIRAQFVTVMEQPVEDRRGNGVIADTSRHSATDLFDVRITLERS